MGKIVGYIALGSNVGDRGETLLSAVRMLGAHPNVQVQRVSQFFATESVGGPSDQPAYLNAAVQIATDLTPQELLAVLHEIEHALGRDRAAEQRWGPRTCDLDILLLGELVMDTEELTIPHPRMHERSFVLDPLASIAPEAVHPVLGKTIAELAAEARSCRRG
jgi:2-amino-4-hydroxy-6-hydroxymethyldihydropteridine diphosphokinase